MRVGVIVPGQYRSFDKTIELFDQNVINHNSDCVFEMFIRFKKEGVNYETVKNILTHPRVKALAIVDNDEEVAIEPQPGGVTNYHNYYQSIKGLNDCFQFCKLYIDITKYDILFHLRPDYHIRDKLKLSDFDCKEKVHIPSGCDWLGGLNDQCSFGDPLIMEKIFTRCTDYLKPTSHRHPETHLKLFCEQNNITVCRFDINSEIVK